MSSLASGKSTRPAIREAFASGACSSNSILKLERLDWYALACIIGFAFVPRLLLLLSLPPLLHLDSDSYFEIVQRLWAGHGLGDLSRRTPLYPLFLAALGRSSKAGLLPVVVVQHLLGIAAAVLCYLIARRLFPRQRAIALASGLLSGGIIHPAVLEQSILSESLYSLLLLAAGYAALAWLQEGGGSFAAGCGALLALAALTRPIAAGIFPLWAGLLFPLRGVRQAMRFLLAAAPAFLLLLLPLLIRNQVVTGHCALTESAGRNLISVTDRLVDYDHGVQLTVKAIYRDFLPEKRGPDAVVVYAAMPRLRKETHWTDIQIDRALAQIAWEAVRAHPVQYVGSRLRRLPLLFRSPEPSQWPDLHSETYVPLVEFVGRFDPELVSRSVLSMRLKDVRFSLARRIYFAFAVDLTSGWLIVVPLLGIAVLLLRETRSGAWLWAGLLAYVWIGTILLQPPNARYRLPTLPLEILFAVAGIYFAGQTLFWLLTRAGQASNPFPFSDRELMTAVASIVLLTFAVKAGLAFRSHPVFDLSEWKRNSAADVSLTPEFRELQMAGTKQTVLYWNSHDLPAGEVRTISAEIPVMGRRQYRFQAAYSCELRQCAGASVEVSFFDSAGAAIDSSQAVSRNFAQERVDNDLFWDEIDWAFEPPATARRTQLTLRFHAGMGNLVIPYLSIAGQ